MNVTNGFEHEQVQQIMSQNTVIKQWQKQSTAKKSEEKTAIDFVINGEYLKDTPFFN